MILGLVVWLLSAGVRADPNVDCADLDPSFLANGFLTCEQLGLPSYHYLCELIPDAKVTCCTCGGGGPAPSRTPEPDIPALTTQQISEFSFKLQEVLTRIGGCNARDGDCAKYALPMLQAMHTYLLDETGNQVADFVAQVLHETGRFRSFYQEIDQGAGAFHMTPSNHPTACRRIPALKQTMTAALPTCPDPCTCSPDRLSLEIQTDYAFITAAWWLVEGSELLLGSSHGCKNLPFEMSVGLGNVNAGCTYLPSSAALVDKCQIEGFYLVSYCIFGSLNDQGMPQRLQYFQVAQEVFADGQGPIDNHKNSDKKLSTKTVIILAVVFTSLFLICMLYCCVCRTDPTTGENLHTRIRESVQDLRLSRKIPKRVESTRKKPPTGFINEYDLRKSDLDGFPGLPLPTQLVPDPVRKSRFERLRQSIGFHKQRSRRDDREMADRRRQEARERPESRPERRTHKHQRDDDRARPNVQKPSKSPTAAVDIEKERSTVRPTTPTPATGNKAPRTIQVIYDSGSSGDEI